MIEKYDECYTTYTTADLSDVRLPKFIDALVHSKPVSFQQKIYLIKVIRMTSDQTIIVLREFGK